MKPSLLNSPKKLKVTFLLFSLLVFTSGTRIDKIDDGTYTRFQREIKLSPELMDFDIISKDHLSQRDLQLCTERVAQVSLTISRIIDRVLDSKDSFISLLLDIVQNDPNQLEVCFPHENLFKTSINRMLTYLRDLQPIRKDTYMENNFKGKQICNDYMEVIGVNVIRVHMTMHGNNNLLNLLQSFEYFDKIVTDLQNNCHNFERMKGVIVSTPLSSIVRPLMRTMKSNTNTDMDSRTTYDTTTTTTTTTTGTPMELLSENCRWKTISYKKEALELIKDLVYEIKVASKTTEESFERLQLLRARRTGEQDYDTTLDITLPDRKLLLRRIAVLYNRIVGKLEDCGYRENLEFMDYKVISRISSLRDPLSILSLFKGLIEVPTTLDVVEILDQLYTLVIENVTTLEDIKTIPKIDLTSTRLFSQEQIQQLQEVIDKKENLNGNPKKWDKLMDYFDYDDEDVDIRRPTGVEVDDRYEDERVQKDRLRTEKHQSLRQFIKAELCWKKELMDSSFFENIKDFYMGIKEFDNEMIEKLLDMVYRCDTEVSTGYLAFRRFEVSRFTTQCVNLKLKSLFNPQRTDEMDYSLLSRKFRYLLEDIRECLRRNEDNDKDD